MDGVQGALVTTRTEKMESVGMPGGGTAAWSGVEWTRAEFCEKSLDDTTLTRPPDDDGGGRGGSDGKHFQGSILAGITARIRTAASRPFPSILASEPGEPAHSPYATG